MPIIENGAITTFDALTNARILSLEYYAFKPPTSEFWNNVMVGQPIEGTKFNWWIDKPLPTKTTVKSGHNYTSNDLQVYLTSGDGVVKGSQLKIGNTIYRVNSITRGTDDIASLTLLSLVDASHTAGSEIKFLVNSNPQNSTYPTSDYIDSVAAYNCTQIFLEGWGISRTQAGAKRETPGSQFEEDLRKRKERLYLQMAQTVWDGIRYEAPTKDIASSMGGVYDLISQPDYGYKATATAFTEDNINTFLETMEYEHGADVKNGTSQLWMKRADYNRFLALNTNYIRTDQSNTTVGRIINRYVSKKLDVELRVDNNCTEKLITLINPNQVVYRPYINGELQWKQLPEETDGYRYALTMEGTIEIKNIGTCGIFEIA
jgi:hypothetical protein